MLVAISSPSRRSIPVLAVAPLSSVWCQPIVKLNWRLYPQRVHCALQVASTGYMQSGSGEQTALDHQVSSAGVCCEWRGGTQSEGLELLAEI